MQRPRDTIARMRTLYVAAGGGGDAVGALLARRALGDTDERPALVSTCAWERLRIDPVPGPRARSDFTDLADVGGESCEVLPSSDTTPPGRSVLPRLTQTSGARIFLHDFEEGADGLTGQLQRLAKSLEVDNLIVVDVGGDIVAQGAEPGLRSPLADSLTLAAALQVDIPMAVAVLGPGADGELSEGEVFGRLTEIGSGTAERITAEDVRSLEPVLSWHPTEATSLVAAAAKGLRGRVAMRRGHTPVPITDRTTEVWVIRNPFLGSFPMAHALQEARSLADAEERMRAAAVNEIDFERKIAEQPRRPQGPDTLSRLLRDMRAIGATHITDRRLTESLGRQSAAAVAAASKHKGGELWSLDELVYASRAAH